MMFYLVNQHKFITAENVVFHLMISCQAIPEFFALKLATFRVKNRSETQKNVF